MVAQSKRDFEVLQEGRWTTALEHAQNGLKDVPMEVDALIISNTPSVTAQGLGTKEGAAKYVRHLNHTTPILFLNSALPFMVTERVMATEY